MFQVYDTDLIMSRLKFISIYKYMIQKCSPNPYSPFYMSQLHVWKSKFGISSRCTLDMLTLYLPKLLKSLPIICFMIHMIIVLLMYMSFLGYAGGMGKTAYV